jgi:hypothetical protein
MKTPILIFCACIALLMTASCTKNHYSGEYQESYNAWLKFKTKSNNSYKYTIYFESFSGFKEETVIYVRNGIVVRRSFKATTKDGNYPPTISVTEEWAEEKVSLNTHQKGADIKTLDELYAEAENKWLKKRDNAKTYFEAKNEGMISTAGYVENNCADDCFRGITISSISKEIYAN